MKIILISYDLNGNRKDYQGLFETIQSLGDSCRCLKSAWLLYTNVTPQQVNDYLRLRCLDKDDHLLVTEIKLSTVAGWLSIDACNWINARIPAYR
jgi:hypothetical protein